MKREVLRATWKEAPEGERERLGVQGGPAFGGVAEEPGAAAGALGQAQPASGLRGIPRRVEGRRNRDESPHLQQTGHGVPILASGGPLFP